MRLTIVVEDLMVLVDGLGIVLEQLPSEVPSNVNALQWHDTAGSIEYTDGTPELEITELPSWASLCVTEYNAIAEIIKEAEQEPPADVKARKRRNALLFETDWWALSDNTMTAEQAAYRQALRDVTSQAGFPQNVTWPTKPEGH